MNYISNILGNTYPGHQELANTKKTESGLGMLFNMQKLELLGHNSMLQNNTENQFSQYNILWIKKGAGTINVDMANFEIIDKMVVCFSPGQLIRLNNLSLLEGYFISFSAEFAFLSEFMANAALLESVFDSQNVSIINPGVKLQMEMEVVISKMEKEFESHSIFRSQILKGLLKVFVIYLSRHLCDKDQYRFQDRDTEMVRKFILLVRKKFLINKMVGDYARELSVSPSYLNRIVKKISGFTASHHIQQCIILEAKRQAIYSGLSMKEVAYLLGFNDYAHFSKFFKNNSGSNFTSFKSMSQ